MMLFDRNLKYLLDLEFEFLEYACPSYSLRSEDIIRDQCCSNLCILNIKRIDILEARKRFVEFARNSGESSKSVIRNMFIRRMQRIIKNHVYFTTGNNVCLVLLARIFGCSVYTLINNPNEPVRQKKRYARPVYKKTSQAVGAALAVIYKRAEPNPVSGLLLSPSMTDKQIQQESKSRVTLKLVRKITGLKIRRRKIDSLLRCSVCCNLKHRIDRTYGSDRREAQWMLKVHYQIIALERSIIEAYENISRDEDSDVLLMKMDSASNNSSKLPILENRSKSIGDSHLVSLHVTNVQTSVQNGALKYSNLDYVDLSGKYSFDSMYYISLLFDRMSKIETIPARLIIVVDSCPTNKSERFLAGLAILMLKCERISAIDVLYHHVGHTHNSCDGHFGNLNTKLETVQVRDPQQFVETLESMNCVAEVSTSHTVYDFETVDPFIRKFKFRSTNNQVSLYKSKGIITWSSTSYITSDLLYADSLDKEVFEFFKPGFDFSKVVFKCVKPDQDGKAKEKCEDLFENAGELIGHENREEFSNFCTNGGKLNIRSIFNKINTTEPKGYVLPDVELSSDTIIQRLQRMGYNTNRSPINPHK